MSQLLRRTGDKIFHKV